MPRGIDRRKFLKTAARVGATLSGAGIALSHPSWLRFLLSGHDGRAFADGTLSRLIADAPIARFWISSSMGGTTCSSCHDFGSLPTASSQEHKETVIKCLLCAHECLISEGERGRCRARIHVKGKLKTLVYGRPITAHIDPIEKKPFYHFMPGRNAFSLATSGCPLRCKFCQNWEISQASPEDYDTAYTAPLQIARSARERSTPIIAFTYNEPTVFMEYLSDIARSAKTLNIRSVLISCGFMKEKPLAEMCEVLDAIKIDLKGFSQAFYRNVSGAELEPVLRSIKQVAKSGTHLEIVNLVVPTLNDSEKMLNGLADWIMGEIGPDVPIHFTRFHPDYKLRNLSPTPVETLRRARAIAMDKGIRYAFVGNVPGDPGNHTYCPACSKPVIKRRGFFIDEMKLKDGKCIECNTRISGVWS